MSAGDDALEELLGTMSQDERDQISVMERVKARVLRTGDRDDRIDQDLRLLLRDLRVRLDPSRPLGPGNRIESRALVVTGKTGAGKSSLISRTLAAHPAFPNYGVPRSGCRAVTIPTPSPCNPKALGLEILRVLDYPMSAQRSLPYIFARVRERIEALGKLVLHFDEVHNVLENANEREVRDIRKMFKTLLVSPSWPVVLILSGLPEIVPFFEGLADLDDDGNLRPDTKGEVRRRGRFIHLASLRLSTDDDPGDADMVAAAVEDVAVQGAGLTLQEDARHTIVPRLMHAALYELGSTMQLTHEAIGEALSSVPPSSRLGLEHFKLAYRGRTGCADAVNPFVARDWIKLDCRLVLKANRDRASAATFGGAAR